MANIIQTKQCSICNQIKSVSEFSKRKNGIIGFYAECKTCASNRIGKYNKTEKGIIKTRIAVRKYQKNYRPKHPQEIKARNTVCYAIEVGILPPVKTLNCSCNQQAEQYHHPDYSKPLSVIPLCRKCHRNIHKAITA